MDEWFLLEQLNRIQAMSERMSEAHSRAAEVSEQILRDRELMWQHPLYQVRDFRIEQPYDPLDAPRCERSGSPAPRRRRQS